MEKLGNTNVIPRHFLEWLFKHISNYNMHLGVRMIAAGWETLSCILLGVFSVHPGRSETKLMVLRRNTYMFSFCGLQRFGSIVKKLCSTQGCPVLCPRCYLKKINLKTSLKGSDLTFLVTLFYSSLQLLETGYSISKSVSRLSLSLSVKTLQKSSNSTSHQES